MYDTNTFGAYCEGVLGGGGEDLTDAMPKGRWHSIYMAHHRAEFHIGVTCVYFRHRKSWVFL